MRSSCATGWRLGKLRPGASTCQPSANSRSAPPLRAHSLKSPISTAGHACSQPSTWRRIGADLVAPAQARQVEVHADHPHARAVDREVAAHRPARLERRQRDRLGASSGSIPRRTSSALPCQPRLRGAPRDRQRAPRACRRAARAAARCRARRSAGRIPAARSRRHRARAAPRGCARDRAAGRAPRPCGCCSWRR